MSGILLRMLHIKEPVFLKLMVFTHDLHGF